MKYTHETVHQLLIHFSVIFFTFALAWFSFVYYPKLVRENRPGDVHGQIVIPVVASSSEFPIETDAFRISYDEVQNVYSVYVTAKSLEDFVLGRSAASLSLKNALSVESLCGLEIIYTASRNVKVPEKYLEESC